MILENVKFGDKFVTRDGRIAVIIGEHKTSRKHWYDFVCLDENADMINDTPYKWWVHDDGTAFEDFDWLDFVEKLD